MADAVYLENPADNCGVNPNGKLITLFPLWKEDVQHSVVEGHCRIPLYHTRRKDPTLHIRHKQDAKMCYKGRGQKRSITSNGQTKLWERRGGILVYKSLARCFRHNSEVCAQYPVTWSVQCIAQNKWRKPRSNYKLFCCKQGLYKYTNTITERHICLW